MSTSVNDIEVTLQVGVNSLLRGLNEIMRAMEEPAKTPARVPYEDLTEQEQEAIQGWLRIHHVDPKTTPTGAVIEYDPATDEWRIEQFARRDGKIVLDTEHDRVRTKFLRRVRKTELAWRRE